MFDVSDIIGDLISLIRRMRLSTGHLCLLLCSSESIRRRTFSSVSSAWKEKLSAWKEKLSLGTASIHGQQTTIVNLFHVGLKYKKHMNPFCFHLCSEVVRLTVLGHRFPVMFNLFHEIAKYVYLYIYVYIQIQMCTSAWPRPAASETDALHSCAEVLAANF